MRDDLYLYPGPVLTFVENTLALSDLDEIVRELQPTFVEVSVKRRVAGPAAGGMHPEAALVIAFGVAAGSFLAEFGKDAYRGLRAALFAAYGKAKAWANGRGYAPLTMEVAQSEKDVILFIFPPSMSSTTFDQAILKLLEVYPTVDAHPTQGMMAVWLEWDDDKGDWKSQDW